MLIYIGSPLVQVVACSAPSHYLSQLCLIVNWVRANKIQWHWKNRYFIFKNAFEISSANWRPFYWGINVFMHFRIYTMIIWVVNSRCCAYFFISKYSVLPKRSTVYWLSVSLVMTKCILIVLRIYWKKTVLIFEKLWHIVDRLHWRFTSSTSESHLMALQNMIL